MSKPIQYTDHIGNTFPHLKSMCDYYNINKTTYQDRIKNGWSQKDALTIPSQKEYKDHLGNIFSTITEMCNHYNINKTTYDTRIRNGWSQEAALTVPSQKEYKDHLGNTFSSLKEMCNYWNIPWSTYKSRTKNGWSLEKKLTTPAQKVKPTPCKDHIGNQFPTIKAMCDYWNISVNTYANRTKKGWSLDKILTTPMKKAHKPHIWKDHTGNTFPNLKAMCNHWGIESDDYYYRIQNGMSSEQALTTPKINRTVTDPFGNIFANKKELCQYYQTNYVFYKSRTNLSQIERLKLIQPIGKHTSHWTFDDKLQVIKPIENQYFLCIFYNHESIMHYDKIIEYCTKQLQIQYQTEKATD